MEEADRPGAEAVVAIPLGRVDVRAGRVGRHRLECEIDSLARVHRSVGGGEEVVGEREQTLRGVEEVAAVGVAEIVVRFPREDDGPLVETEFWNGDALFMPQFHSARDIHDVYYLKDPSHAREIEQPWQDQVAKTHENGWETGSKGWGYGFDRDFTRRLVLRSQGTVLSAKQLPKAKVPGRYFGVVRCFRYDQVDATHGSDFYQTEGIVLFGGSGQGYVGNGWFLGGFGNGGGLSRTVTVLDGTTEVERKIGFAMGFGGLTVEKRLAPFSWATLSAGIGLGGGGIDLSVSQDDGNFSWSNLGTELLNTNSTTVNFSKNYAIVHPRASLMLRLTGWMRIKAEYGYLYGYSFSDGWNTTLGNGSMDLEDNSYELVGSPNTALEASTISLGLWFGF